jgi:WD40 repeat protein
LYDVRDVSSLLQDTSNTVRDYIVPISTIALQVYHSVLVFMPDCALYKRASQSAVPIARLVTARESTWQVQSGVDLEGHTGAVLYVAFSPDGSSILSCSGDGTARVWDASTGEAKTVFAEHKGQVRTAAFSPDGLLVTSADFNDGIYTWDVSTGLKTGRAPHSSYDGYVKGVAYSRDGARIILCSQSITSFIDVANHQLLRVIHLSSLLHTHTGAWRISADGSRLSTTDHTQGLVKIWDICDKTELVCRADFGPMPGYSGPIFSADGQRAAFMNDRDVLTIIEFPKDGDVCRSTFETLGMKFDRLHMIAISSSAKTSVALHSSVGAGGTLLVDLSSEPLAVNTLGRGRGDIYCVAFSPDGAQVVWGSDQGIINVWNTESGRPQPSSLSSRLSSSRAVVNGTYLSRDGLQVVSVDETGLIEIHSTVNGSLATSVDPWYAESERYSRFIRLASSPDSLRLAFFNSDGIDCLHIWDLQAGSIIASPQTIPQGTLPVWSLDSSRCAVAVEGNRIHVVNGSSGSVQADLRFPDVLEPDYEIHFKYAEFSSNSRHLLVIFDEMYEDHSGAAAQYGFTQHTHLWSTDTWSLHSVAIFYDCRYRRVSHMYETYRDEVSAFSPNGTHLVIYSRKEKVLHLCAVDDEGSICHTVRKGNDARILEVTWSRDGFKVALGDHEEVLIWSTTCSTACGMACNAPSCDLTIIFRLGLSQLHEFVAFSADSLRLMTHTSEHKKYSHVLLPTSNDPTGRAQVITDNTSVDIIASRNSGWLLCSRADRADLVPILWVPRQRRWWDAAHVAVVGSKVAFRSACGDLVTVLEFPSLRDLYYLFEPDHNH